MSEYRDAIAEALGDRDEIVLVAQSMAGFSAPLVCDRDNVRMLVLVNATVPKPFETIDQWWQNTRCNDARAAFVARMGWPNADLDVDRDFFHDVSAEIKAAAYAAGEPVQSRKPFAEPWPLPRWPAVSTRFIAGRDDRFSRLRSSNASFASGLGSRSTKLRAGI